MTAACWCWRQCPIYDGKLTCSHAIEARKKGRRVSFGDISEPLRPDVQLLTKKEAKRRCLLYKERKQGHSESSAKWLSTNIQLEQILKAMLSELNA